MRDGDGSNSKGPRSANEVPENGLQFRMTLAAVVGNVTVIDPLPYLPNNSIFGEDIKVIYALMTVT